MDAYNGAWSNHCFNRTKISIGTYKMNRGRNTCLDLLITFFFFLLCSATFLWSALLCWTHTLCSLRVVKMNVKHSFCLRQKIFPLNLDFKISPTVFMFLSVLQSVRGGRWAFGSRDKRPYQFNIPTLPLCPEPNKQGSFLIQINYTKTLS